MRLDRTAQLARCDIYKDTTDPEVDIKDKRKIEFAASNIHVNVYGFIYLNVVESPYYSDLEIVTIPYVAIIDNEISSVTMICDFRDGVWPDNHISINLDHIAGRAIAKIAGRERWSVVLDNIRKHDIVSLFPKFNQRTDDIEPAE